MEKTKESNSIQKKNIKISLNNFPVKVNIFETISKIRHEIIGNNSLKAKYSHLADILSSKKYMSTLVVVVSFLSEFDIVLMCEKVSAIK